MRIEVLGQGEPEVAIVGGIHGDEPAGIEAIQALIAEAPAVERPVALVIANERAADRDERYVDEDLNRAFPGDPDGDTHETALAAELHDELGDCETLVLHSTQSYEDLFAIVHEVGAYERRICPQLPIDALVDAGEYTDGRVFAAMDAAIEIECGLQGSAAAAENALAATRAFLQATGALAGEPGRRQDLPVYRLEGPIDKPEAARYEVFVENFAEVDADEVFARAGDTDLSRPESFYPVLLSAYGYEDVFGYAASLTGTLS